MRHVIGLICCLWMPAAWAQTAPPEPEPEHLPVADPVPPMPQPDAVPAPSEEPAPAASADESSSEAAAQYKVGLDLMGQGKYAQACAIFKKVSQTWPGSDYAVKAEQQMATAALAEGGDACGGEAPQGALESTGEGTAEPAQGAVAPAKKHAPPPEQKRKNGNVSLAISQGLVGPATLGVFVPLALKINEPAVYLTGGLLGLGAGIALPLVLTRKHPVTVGQAMVIFSAEAIGGWNGLMLSAAIPPLWNSDTGPFPLITAGTLLGAGAGTAAALLLKPSAGQVSMFNAGATWGTYFAGISFFVAGVDSAQPAFLHLGLGADGLGLVAAILSTQFPISSLRMNLINLSGYAGALGLGLVYGIISLAADSTSTGAWFGVLGTGAIGGIVTGVVLTRHTDGDRQVTDLFRGAPIVVEGGHAHFGLPMPTPRVVRDGSVGVDLPLAFGRF